MRNAALVLSLLAAMVWSLLPVSSQTIPAAACKPAGGVSGTTPPGDKAPTVNPHAYFQSLTARADCLAAYSLRNKAQIEQYRRGRTRVTSLTYDPAADPDPRQQDAAKVLIPEGRVSLPTQVRVPLPEAPGGFLITWDAWWGKEFAFDNTGIGQFKAFQLASDSRIWTEIRAAFKAAANPRNAGAGAVAMVDVRSYGGRGGGYVGANVTKNQPLSPQIEQFGVMPETWTRYWVLLSPAADGFFEFSLWVADERRDPVKLHDKLLIKPTKSGSWNQFWLEYNTSSKPQPRKIEPLVAYARNIVMLRDVKDAAPFLKKP